jgi:hypothetical protein
MTLLRVFCGRGFAFYRVSFQYIHRTDLHTQIASIADFFIENNGPKHDSPPIENRKSNATRVPAILTCDFGRFIVLALTSPFEKGGLRGISLGLKSPLAPLC